MNLVIVESPSKAKTIEKYLGKEYIVKASVGHIRDLPSSEKNSVDIENGYKPLYIISPKKEEVINELKRIQGEVNTVLLATDPDREGEAIAWHLSEVLNLKKPKRVVFNEVTKDVVWDAIQNPRALDNKLRESQEARRVLDRLFGYGLSRLIWTKVRYGLSAGRVQSPALRILVARELEIKAFKPTPYFVVHAHLKYKNTPLTFSTEDITDEKTVLKIKKDSSSHTWSVQNVTEKKVSRNPYPPFITSTLQQTANTRLHYSPSKTMRVAQKLYERGYITYMRTDSPMISKQALESIKGEIVRLWGASAHRETLYKSRKKSAQEAHEAIRPTALSKKEAGSTQEERNLYALIRARTLASQMIPAQVMRTKVTVSYKSTGVPFYLHGVKTIVEGWIKADPQSIGNEVIIPDIKKGEPLTFVSIENEKKETTPPPRYSEAGLVKELEKREIGRPSTYASIISTLIQREYVKKDGQRLTPTDTGIVINTFLTKNFSDYISDSFTMEMENKLDDIARGIKNYSEVLDDFYKPFVKEIKNKKDVEKITVFEEAPSQYNCPQCSSSMQMRLSRYGAFMSCKKFPDCKGMRTREGEIVEEPKNVGRPCPTCTKGELVKRANRNNEMFIACNRYPKCKYVENDPEEEKKSKTGVQCPECKNAELHSRKGRFGVFYGCGGYPNCTFTIRAKPTGKTCPFCSSLMMEGTKTIPIRCSNKVCKNHRPDKLK